MLIQQRIELINTQSAAKELGWHINTVIKWCRLGKLIGVRSSDARKAPYLFDKSEVLAIKNANNQK
jgi:hypothetical protein